MQLLKGQLIVLRALEPEDLETLYAWENNSNVWHLSNTITPYSKHLLRDYIYNTQYDIFTAKQLRLMICKDNLPVGCIDLYDFDPYHLRAGVGILIADEQHRGQGLAKDALQVLCHYAFVMLQLHQLYCHINADNLPSIALFTAVGFKETGNKKQWNKVPAGFVDELIFQRIAES